MSTEKRRKKKIIGKENNSILMILHLLCVSIYNNRVENRPRGQQYIIGETLTIADIAVCSVLGFMGVRFPEHEWKQKYPQLREFWEHLETTRDSFASTQPKAQTYKDRIV